MLDTLARLRRYDHIEDIRYPTLSERMVPSIRYLLGTA